MIETELEERLFTRTVRRSSFSMAISFTVHLALFLALALVMYGVQQGGLIEIQGEQISQAPESLELESLELDVTSLSDALDTEMEQLPVEVPQIDPSPLAAVSWDHVDKIGLGQPSVPMPPSLSTDNESSQGGFFGIKPTGDRIVYVIDMSPSMSTAMGPQYPGQRQRRYDRAVKEVISSVGQLKESQRFYVIMFCYQKNEIKLKGYTDYYPATPKIKSALEKELRRLRLCPGTDPRESLVAALNLNPSCCFLLSDGEFNGRKDRAGPFGGGVKATVLARRYNQSGCPIHTIGLANKGNQADMMKIAKQSGGNYLFIENNREF